MRQLIILILLGILLHSSTATAQRSTETRPSDQNTNGTMMGNGGGLGNGRWQLGGDVGLSFGNQAGFVIVSPLVGYRVSDRFTAGSGPSFEHYWQRFSANDQFKLTTLGGRTFARYQLFDFLFTHGEYALVNIKTTYAGQSINQWVSRLPLGGGISQRLGGNSYATFMVLYDVLYNPDSPYNFGNTYNGLILRGGIMLGL